MRTTVTLDKDVEHLLRDEMHKTRRSFKETLNSAVRSALGSPAPKSKKHPFVVKAFPMGLRAGIDPGSLNSLADALGRGGPSFRLFHFASPG